MTLEMHRIPETRGQHLEKYLSGCVVLVFFFFFIYLVSYYSDMAQLNVSCLAIIKA